MSVRLWVFLDVESPEAEFYDLVSNPERFTGYSGPSAVNIWKLIYDQNCFKYAVVPTDCFLGIPEPFVKIFPHLTLPYLTFRVGRLLHLPSAEAVSVRPNAQPRCNQRSQ